MFARQARLAHQTGDLVTASGKGPRVLVVPISGASTARTIQLPASVHGYIETPVYAKVAGYMKTILIDKGDHVRKGQIIAIIESPETDQASRRCAGKLPPATGDRSARSVSARERSYPAASGGYSTAAMLQAKATYEQELALQRYEVVTAPFDGIISARFVDPGTLIPQSTTPTTGLPIVAMATLAPVRIYAYVPQSVAPYVNDGDTATVTVTEFPGRKFAGTVTRHPEALDQNTRTMLVEVDLPNPDRSLLPGMYADVNISTRAAAGGILVPDDALVFRNNKIYLPLVRGERVHLAEVALGRDDGYQVEVTGDVQPGDLVAMNLSQAARDNELVQPVQIPGA